MVIIFYEAEGWGAMCLCVCVCVRACACVRACVREEGGGGGRSIVQCIYFLEGVMICAGVLLVKNRVVMSKSQS